MKRLEHSAFLALRDGAQILEADSHGEKVLRLANGQILKLFRRKRILSSTLWSPYALRFCANAKRLDRLGFIAPTIIEVFRVPELKRDCVLYDPVPGTTLRQLFRDNPAPEDIGTVCDRIALFVRTLFDHGVYFRSLHLGNIVQTPDGCLGLIDIADLRVLPFALPTFLRQRNVQRILRISEPGETAWILQDKMIDRGPTNKIAAQPHQNHTL